MGLLSNAVAKKSAGMPASIEPIEPVEPAKPKRHIRPTTEPAFRPGSVALCHKPFEYRRYKVPFIFEMGDEARILEPAHPKDGYRLVGAGPGSAIMIPVKVLENHFCEK